MVDTVTLELASDLRDGAQNLIQILEDARAPEVLSVEQSVQLARLVDALTAGLVGRARRSRVPWKDLGCALAMSPEHARRTYRKETIYRRLLSVPRSRRAAAASREHVAPAPVGGAGPLGQVLSGLQRTSKVPTQSLAQRIGITIAELDAVLSGERFPTWRVTESIAQACGADAEVLRKVWEDERRRKARDR